VSENTVFVVILDEFHNGAQAIAVADSFELAGGIARNHSEAHHAVGGYETPLSYIEWRPRSSEVCEGRVTITSWDGRVNGDWSSGGYDFGYSIARFEVARERR